MKISEGDGGIGRFGVAGSCDCCHSDVKMLNVGFALVALHPADEAVTGGPSEVSDNPSLRLQAGEARLRLLPSPCT